MFEYLLSFHYYRSTDLDALAGAAGRPDLTVFADSGAFSAEHAGAVVTVPEYADWLKRWDHRIHVYASLDVLHDSEQTWANTEQLRRLGLDPMPVFHAGQPLRYYDRALEESDYVAIGGMVRNSLGSRDRKFWAYLNMLHEKAAARNVRLHGFGICSWPIIRDFPWYSVDSSDASVGVRYGTLSVYDMYADTWRSWTWKDRKSWGKYGWLVREYDMRPDDFKKDGMLWAQRVALMTIAARSWAVAAARLGSTRIYQTPVLNAQAIKADPSKAVVGREVMDTYENANRWATKLYVADGALTRKSGYGGRTRLGVYEDNRTFPSETGGLAEPKKKAPQAPVAPGGQGQTREGPSSPRPSARRPRSRQTKRAGSESPGSPR